MDKYFSVVKKTLKFNQDDVPLTYTLNKKDYNRSFTLGIFENTDLIFSCRLYYLNKSIRKKLNIKYIKYELSDVFLYDMYRGKMIANVKYSKICLELISSYKKGLILWTTKDNTKAIKRYLDINFKIEKNNVINNYYQKIAYDKFNIEKNNVIVFMS